jgi:two-component system, NarL family, nitrate/nitrite response regulator NarL
MRDKTHESAPIVSVIGSLRSRKKLVGSEMRSDSTAACDLKRRIERPAVVVLSDVRVLREGLSLSLSTEGSLDILGAFASMVSLIEDVTTRPPDAIILDMTTCDGLELARELHANFPTAKIVAFAVRDVEDEIIAGAMAGISTCVHRDAGVGDLVAEVLNTVNGELHCSPRLAARLLQQITSMSSATGAAAHTWRDNPSGLKALTRRELEVMTLVERGLSNKEIARALHISFATAKNHVHHILEKLQVRRRGQALVHWRARTSRVASPGAQNR